MSRDALYYMPWRKPYEAYAGVTWLIASAAAGVVAWNTASVPPEPIYTMAAFCLVMAIYRMVPVVKMKTQLRRMQGKCLEFIGLDELVKKMRPDEIWLGYAWEWTPREAQITTEILARDPREMGLPTTRLMGSPWIHGIGQAERDYYVPISDLKQHTLIPGSTGTGKTRMLDLFITQVIARGDAVVAIDPKSDPELQRVMRVACERFRKPGTFNYFNLAYPEKSIRLSPTRTWNRSTEIANRIASLIPSETGNDPFKSFAQMMLDKVIQGMLAARMPVTLVNIRRAVDNPETVLERVFEACFEQAIGPTWREELEQLVKVQAPERRVAGYIRHYRQNLAASHPLLQAEGLIAVVEHDREHLGKMIASLMPVLNVLTSSHLARLLSPSGEEEDDAPYGEVSTILNKGEVLYIGTDSLADGMTGSAVGSLFLSELTSIAATRYNYGDLKNERRIWVIVDESAEVVNGESFVQLLNKSRGAGFSIVLCVQVLADFAARLGNLDKAKQILANVNAKVVLRIMESDTQEYITEGMVKTQVASVQVSHNENADTTQPFLFGAGYGERHTMTEAELIPPALIGELPNLEYFALVGGAKMKGRIPILQLPAPQQTG